MFNVLLCQSKTYSYKFYQGKMVSKCSLDYHVTILKIAPCAFNQIAILNCWN